jgi:hypothetical protein
MNIEVNIDTSHSLIDGIGHAKRTCRVLHPTASRQCWCSSKAPCRASTPTRGVLSSLEVDMKLNCSVIKYRGANCNSNRKNESAAGGTLNSSYIGYTPGCSAAVLLWLWRPLFFFLFRGRLRTWLTAMWLILMMKIRAHTCCYIARYIA